MTTAPSTIVPRWEWRTFGAEFGAADEAFAALEPELVQESDETCSRRAPMRRSRSALA
jgi:hypothetical protein